MPQQIPQYDSNLYIDDDTSSVDVIEYVNDRLTDPAIIGDAVVWNFHHKQIDAAALVNADLEPAEYVIPYPVPGVWGFIVDILPERVSDAQLLTYAKSEGRYTVYDNFRHPDHGFVDEAATRAMLRDEMNDSLDRQTEVSDV